MSLTWLLCKLVACCPKASCTSCLQLGCCLQGSLTDSGEDDEDGDDLFMPVSAASAEQPVSDLDAIDAVDASCLPPDAAQLGQWESPEAKESLRNRFVTGEHSARSVTSGQECLQFEQETAAALSKTLGQSI